MKSRRRVLMLVILASILAADMPFDYQELTHRSAILRALDKAWPAERNSRQIVDVDPTGTRALVRTEPIVSCANPIGHYFDIWLVRRDGEWSAETIKKGSYAVADCW